MGLLVFWNLHWYFETIVFFNWYFETIVFFNWYFEKALLVFWYPSLVLWMCQLVFWYPSLVLWMCQLVFWLRLLVFWFIGILNIGILNVGILNPFRSTCRFSSSLQLCFCCKFTFVESSMKAFQKVRKSRQYYVSRQNVEGPSFRREPCPFGQSCYHCHPGMV